MVRSGTSPGQADPSPRFFTLSRSIADREEEGIPLSLDLNDLLGLKP